MTRSPRVAPEAREVSLPEAATTVLAEGPLPIREAARAAGVPTLSYHVVLRAWRSGALQAVRLGGRVHTSPAAILRWLAAAQPAQRLPAPPRRRGRRARPATTPAEARVLSARGLPTGADRR